MIGNGESVTITDDPWVSNNYHFKVQQEACHNPHLMLVKQLMEEANKWNVNLIRNSFNVQVADEILQTEVVQKRFSAVDDRCPWCLNESKFVYHCFISCPHSMEIWRLASSAQMEWSTGTSPFQLLWTQLVDLTKDSPNRKDTFAQVALTIWKIQTTRNEKIFEGKDSSPSVIHGIAQRLSEEFRIHSLSISIIQSFPVSYSDVSFWEFPCIFLVVVRFDCCYFVSNEIKLSIFVKKK